MPPSPAVAGSGLSADGLTVYDAARNITWLADGNLAASNRFTLPLCTGTGSQNCVNSSGAMDYASATAWVSAMNSANYLGHSNWQLPTTPPLDGGCSKTGPNGDSFGYNCAASAMASMYNNLLGLKAPNTVTSIPADAVGPFINLQPYLYWSQTNLGASGYAAFSFVTGWTGANTVTHTIFVLPVIPGKIAGAPAGQTFYDSISNVTWLTNANLAAGNRMGLPVCADATSSAPCVAPDGAMSWDSANQFIANLNAAAYLGQKNWQLPAVDPNCSGYNCSSAANPMGELFYGQFGLSKGMSAVSLPDVTTGPFHNLQPYLYWSCLGTEIASPCQANGPVANQEWSFSLANGFEGTDVLANDLFAIPYYVGAPASSATGPEIIEVANAAGEAPLIAPNAWIEIKGVNLAPPGDSRVWTSADFAGSQMPSQLDQVSVTVNGKSAFVSYISPTQVNVLTPPDAISGAVQVQVTNGGVTSPAFMAQAKAASPSFFVFGGGPYVAAVHASGGLIGPATLYPGSTTPAKPGETILLFANGFGAVNPAVVSGSSVQTGTLPALPAIMIGGQPALVQFAGIHSTPGEFQFNVVVPSGLPNGDQTLVATYNSASTQASTLLSVHN